MEVVYHAECACNREQPWPWSRVGAAICFGRMACICYVTPPKEADQLGRLANQQKNFSIHRMDVTRAEEINALATELMKEPIDLIVHNAGVYLEKYIFVCKALDAGKEQTSWK